MKNKKGSPLLSADRLASIGASLISIVIGLVFGFLFLIVLSLFNSDGEGFKAIVTNAWKYGFKQILMGGFYLPPISIGQEIAATAPLILTGLSVGFAFKTGLFQYRRGGAVYSGRFRSPLLRHCPWFALVGLPDRRNPLWCPLGRYPRHFQGLSEHP